MQALPPIQHGPRWGDLIAALPPAERRGLRVTLDAGIDEARGVRALAVRNGEVAMVRSHLERAIKLLTVARNQLDRATGGPSPM